MKAMGGGRVELNSPEPSPPLPFVEAGGCREKGTFWVHRSCCCVVDEDEEGGEKGRKIRSEGADQVGEKERGREKLESSTPSG